MAARGIGAVAALAAICLVILQPLGGRAATVSVTTLNDTVNGDTGSVAQLLANPGPDGVSLREAILAANNSSPGTSITFHSSLGGQAVFVTAELPAITQDGSSIDGDLDSDGVPDVSLDGSVLATGVGLLVCSSDVSVKGVTISHFPENGIFVWSGSGSLVNVTVRDCTISGNGGDGIVVTNLRSTGHTISGVSIIHNTISENDGMAVLVSGGNRPGASGNATQGVTISGNLIERSDPWGIILEAGGTFATSNTLTDVLVSDNRFIDQPNAALVILAGDEEGAQDNTLRDVAATGNTFEDCNIGVHIQGGSACPAGEVPGPSSDRDNRGNTVLDAVISGNAFDGGSCGIIVTGGDQCSFLAGGGICEGNHVTNCTITANTFSAMTDTGIIVIAGVNSSGHTIRGLSIIGNVTTGTACQGMTLLGGFSTAARAEGNSVEDVSVVSNDVGRTGDNGVLMMGGNGPQASGNAVSGCTLCSNTVAYCGSWGILAVPDVNSAFGNTLDGVAVWNSILWGNSEADILGLDVAAVHACIVGTGAFAGTNGNIDADPRFANVVGGDSHLTATSPAIDAGSDLAPLLPSTDLDGTPRPCGWGHDMGAYEYVPPTGCARASFRVDRLGNVVAHGSVYASGFFTGSADVAEWVEVTGAAEPGDVLEFDADSAQAYRKSQTACSHLVAGVVSTQPGVSLGAGTVGPQQALLALSGIVPVKVTNECGPIQPGDLLVSSSTPGYAMRWAGPEPCPCALVGKALEPMTDEQGLISVLLAAH
jgi:hypothetical protein